MPDEATIPKNGEDTITGQAPPDVPTPSQEVMDGRDTDESIEAVAGGSRVDK